MDHRPGRAAGLLEAHRPADQGLEFGRAPERAGVVVDLEHPGASGVQRHLQPLGAQLGFAAGGDQGGDVAAVDHIADHISLESVERPVFALQPADAAIAIGQHLFLLVQQRFAIQHAIMERSRHVGHGWEQLAEVLADATVVGPAGEGFPGGARRQADAAAIIEHRGARRGDRRPPGLLQPQLLEILGAFAFCAGRLLSHRTPRGPRQRRRYVAA